MSLRAAHERALARIIAARGADNGDGSVWLGRMTIALAPTRAPEAVSALDFTPARGNLTL